MSSPRRAARVSCQPALSAAFLLWLVMLCPAPVAVADDIEIFVGTMDSGDLRPRVMLVIDGATRLDRARELVLAMLDSTGDANVGLAWQDAAGDTVLVPARDLDGRAESADYPAPVAHVAACDPGAAGSCSVRATLRRLAQVLQPGGTLPASTLLEDVRRYLASSDGAIESQGEGEGEGEGERGRHAGSERPTAGDCPVGRHLVLLSDGVSELSLTASRASPGSTVITHTISLDARGGWLENLAREGGGGHWFVDQTSDAADVVDGIIGGVLSAGASFGGLVPVVDQFAQLHHLEQVYVGVFQPDRRPRWRGNLKRYALAQGAAIVDADGRLAVDPATGFFAAGTRSFWSRLPDGAAVERGGAAEQLPEHPQRNVSTYLPGSPSPSLANRANALSPLNAVLDPSAFAVASMSASAFARHLEWIRGRDVDDEDDDGNTLENRHAIGDPLHSRPVAVAYGGSGTDPDVAVFFGTNAGAIHAIDGRSGREHFAFFPAATLPMQRLLRQNLPTTSLPYGIDGSPTLWVSDAGNDGIAVGAAGDFVRLFVGMRRGGRNYYALDVTDRRNPEILWQIEGGGEGPLGDFRELGQTWSQPVRTRIRLAGDTAPRDVLLFSAGYDPAQDHARVRTPDAQGRGMYIVEALTGRLLWSGGRDGAQAWTRLFARMEYAFPSTMAAIDVDQDGLADMWFGADTGGQLWRFDIHNGESVANLVTGGVIGDLGVAGASNEVDSNRRFFAAPSVALMPGIDGPELVVAIGSGFRPSPLSILARNRMYLIRQDAVYRAPADYTAVTDADLYDATDDVTSGYAPRAGGRRPGLPLRSTPRGWFFDFPRPGEKALSSPLIVNDQLLFTSYTPGTGGSPCRPPPGISHAWAVPLAGGDSPVRIAPLATVSLVEQPLVLLPPPDRVAPGGTGAATPALPAAPVDPDDPPAPDSATACANRFAVRWNAEAGPVEDWCNEGRRSYWIRER